VRTRGAVLTKESKERAERKCTKRNTFSPQIPPETPGDKKGKGIRSLLMTLRGKRKLHNETKNDDDTKEHKEGGGGGRAYQGRKTHPRHEWGSG